MGLMGFGCNVFQRVLGVVVCGDSLAFFWLALRTLRTLTFWVSI